MMNSDDLEFLISQYVDGTLALEHIAAVEARLQIDAAARALLADHRRIAALLLEHSGIPAVRFDRLAEVISSNIDQAEDQRQQQVYRFTFGRWVAGAAAVAACVLVGLLVLRSDRSEPGRDQLAAARIVEVAGPTIETATAQRVAIVAIDMPLNNAMVATLAWQDLSPGGARIVVSAGEPPAMPDALSGQ